MHSDHLWEWALKHSEILRGSVERGKEGLDFLTSRFGELGALGKAGAILGRRAREILR